MYLYCSGRNYPSNTQIQDYPHPPNTMTESLQLFEVGKDGFLPRCFRYGLFAIHFEHMSSHTSGLVNEVTALSIYLLAVLFLQKQQQSYLPYGNPCGPRVHLRFYWDLDPSNSQSPRRSMPVHLPCQHRFITLFSACVCEA